MHIETFSGADVTPHLNDLARLRISVFRSFPYLYEGDLAYEANYLATYARSPESLFVLAFDEDRVVGASTGIPLSDEVEAFHKPFLQRGINLGDVFYFGESVLLPEYRGRGIGHRFFDEREAHARALCRFTLTAFCAVMRDANDLRRPVDYRVNDPFWIKRGYVRQPDMRCELEWKEIGADGLSSHSLAFWLRALEASR